jgi:hypothetical protein
MEPTCAVARVTIAKAMPDTRRATAPTTRGSRMPTAVVTSSAVPRLRPNSVIARLAAYVPAAK